MKLNILANKIPLLLKGLCSGIERLIIGKFNGLYLHDAIRTKINQPLRRQEGSDGSGGPNEYGGQSGLGGTALSTKPTLSLTFIKRRSELCVLT